MKQTKKYSKSLRLLSAVLALVMVLSLLPLTVFAEERTQSGTDEISTQSAAISYVTKEKSVPLDTSIFYRIVHIDCGRKYFNVSELKTIIDAASENNYTHVELAFGNDGLRFLLDDMSLTGYDYDSNEVKKAIQSGNKAFYDAGTNELTQAEMDELISYAASKNIGIIPMFDAPGHLQTVVRAMQELKLSVSYTTPTTSGTSVNYSIDPTDAVAVNFVQALMQKYISYFASKGCTMFNIAADECGFTSMSTEKYTAYAKLVNSLAAMVQNAGMTALAFNDGIYHLGLTTNVDFDTDIAICYWDATTTKYAPAATLSDKGFKIINTNNKWYYVLGNEGTSWYGYNWALDYMRNTSENSCMHIDGDNLKTTPVGCMAAMWCDTPANTANWSNIKSYIQTLSTYNKSYFVATPLVSLTADKTELVEGETTELRIVNADSAQWTVEPADVVSLSSNSGTSVTATALKPGTATVTATVNGKTYSKEIKVSELVYTIEAANKYLTPNTSTVLSLNPSVPAEWTSSDESVIKLDIADSTSASISDNSVVATALKIGKATVTATVGDKKASIDLEVNAIKLDSRTITLTVGQTMTETITGQNLEGTYTTEPEGIATVEAKYQKVPGGTVFSQETTATNGSKYIVSTNSGYLKSDASTTQNIEEAAEWTFTLASNYDSTYYLKNGDNYLRCYNNGSLTTTTRTDNGTNLTLSNGVISYRSNKIGTFGAKKTTEPYDETVFTFTAKAVGTTYVTIGNTRFTIQVIAEDLSGVSDLPIQLWITNIPIEVDKTKYSGGSTSGSFRSNNNWSEQKAWYVSVDANDAYGENGVALAEVLPAQMYRYEENITYWISEKTGKAQMDLQLWSGRVHTTSNMQKIWDVDYSNSGTEFNYVRYYNGSWAVSADAKTWTKVTGSGSTASYSSCTEQLAAYYMLRTDITKEVSTDVADWGYVNSDSDYAAQIKTGYYVILDFAVKYEDGTRNPNTFPQDEKTFVFHCNTKDNSGAVKTDSDGIYYRQLNNFRGVNSAEFEIYMVTVTMTDDDASNYLSSTTDYKYAGEEQIVWAIDEEARDDSGLNPYTAITDGDTTYSGCTIGGDPYVRGVEVYNKHGALITYYVRAIVTEDSLYVHYIDNTTGFEFYNYPITVKSGTTFDESFAQATPNNQWGTLLVGNTVVNILDVTQTVSAKLETMLGVPAQYRYSDYVCVDAKRESEGEQAGKHVYLYYEFSSSKTFVVDFGLPLVIQPKDINDNLATAQITKVAVKDSKYATITVDEQYNITYALNKTIDGQDNIIVSYTGINADKQNEQTVTYNLSIIPAANVYYEDSFASFTHGSGSAANAKWSIDGTETSATQLLEELGKKTNVYGKDDAYKNSTQFSMGSAHKVTVTSEMASGWTEGSAWPTATFTFKGTGFDVISLTDNTSGAIFVDVVNTATGNTEKSYMVDNYYGYTQDADGNWVVNKDAKNTLYQIPVMKVTGLAYAEYTVTIRAAYSSFFDHTGDSQYNFWLDAIRVYDPMGTGYADYTKDLEGYPQYIKLRDQIAKNDASVQADVLFIDGAENADIATYANYGPNNEVYLAKGQAITFNVTGENIATIQIGAKAPNGGAAMNVNNNTPAAIDSATEMYYVISSDDNSFTITNTGDGILSLTNLKITFSAENSTAALSPLTTEQQNEAVMAVRALFTVAPVVFEPSRFEASWNRSSVRAGQKATLTVKASEDVDAITVNGQAITTFRVRTERTGWGWWATRVTYREFTYSVNPTETADYEVAAVNADGVSSEALTLRLTVSGRGFGGWLRDIFGF